jgi:hypothetical protein
LRENFDRFNFAIHKEKEMADFRRCFLALAVLVLVIGCVAPASAQVVLPGQSFACVANAAVPPTLRQEGMTEMVGDIVLNCTGGTATMTGNIPQANVTVFLNNITSRVLSGGNLTESLLLIDDPTTMVPCPTPNTGCVVAADGGASFKTNGAPNVYQGVLTGPNAITFLGVPIDPPATAGAPARVFRITNVRINANAYPAGSPAYPVTAYVSISGSTSVPITNPTPIVGFISPGLTATATAGPMTSFLQCEGGSAVVTTLTYKENFATAFKVRDFDPTNNGGQSTPGAIYNTESGLILEMDGSIAGLADAGTRLKAYFQNLPHGVTLSVPPTITEGSLKAVLVGSTLASDTVPVGSTYGLPTALSSGTLTISYPTTACDPATPSSCNNGTALAVYEVIADNPFAIDRLDVPVTMSYTGAPGTPSGVPEISSIAGTNPNQVTLSYAPTPNGGSASFATFIPRFADSTNVFKPLFTVSLCQTVLLFPYVTDYPGFDTGIAISNTSMDPLPSGWSASPQSGACTVNFYGGVTDASTGNFVNTAGNLGSSGVYDTVTANTFNTGMVGPGQTWAFSVSGIDKTLGNADFQGFVGYAIAICDFQYAHGYSFVSDFGLRNFAAAYLALVIPDTARAAVPNICSATGQTCNPFGEQLVH